MSSTLHIPGTAVAVVIDLPFLASEINDAHREVIYAGRSMLRWAETAGILLLKVKEKVRHGEFKAWVEANCEAPYDTAVQYMRVAKIATSKNVEVHTFDGGIRAFLEAHSTPRPKTPCPTVTTIDRDDAAHALKLQALVERGTTEAERDVAQRKLEAFAKGFGHTAEAMVSKAQGLLPDHEKTDKQVRMERAEAEAQAAKAETEAARAEAASLRAQLNAILTRTKELETEVQKLSRDELVARYIGLVLEREGLAELKKAA